MTTLRIRDDVWADIRAQAKELGCSPTEFMREAIVMRVARAPVLARVDDLEQRVGRLERAGRGPA